MSVKNKIKIKQKYVYGDIETNRLPLLCGIEVTFKCNLSCKHCYIKASEGKQEVSTSDLKKIITDISKLRPLWLVLTGGEPFLRDDFIDIYTHAKKLGFLIVIFSNGTLIREDVIKCLRELPPFLIELTTYGYTKNIYEQVTGVKGSYELYKRGLNLLLENKIKFRLRSICMQTNKDEISDIKDFAKKIGVDFGYYGTLRPRIGTSESPEITLSPREIVGFDRLDKKRWEEDIKKFKNKDCTFYACNMALVSFLINPYGELDVRRMASCFPNNYNLKKMKLTECWQDFTSKFGMHRESANCICRNCGIPYLCDKTCSLAELGSGCIQEKRGYLCEIAQERLKYFT